MCESNTDITEFRGRDIIVSIKEPCIGILPYLLLSYKTFGTEYKSINYYRKVSLYVFFFPYLYFSLTLFLLRAKKINKVKIKTP